MPSAPLMLHERGTQKPALLAKRRSGGPSLYLTASVRIHLITAVSAVPGRRIPREYERMTPHSSQTFGLAKRRCFCQKIDHQLQFWLAQMSIQETLLKLRIYFFIRT